ncbi:hypothetical protein [Roseateles amylovorans]|uniref:Uncharacterized protein n=1 Tax=Roseateles amylovorans TaxID=2978473 RepID=A0ABY6B8D2_9BURK|nr:hypothetical protein [Roseateles amylovorans]UXH80633.1 hypothetical protein N4261_12455 [Roseateles amylovorans]
MDIKILVSFLGHSSVHDAFDEFLIENEIKMRPKLSDSYPYKVKSSEPGLALTFEDSAEAKGMARKSEGQFVFHEIYFDFDPHKGVFLGELPFGIGAARSIEGIEAVLGSPRVRRDSANPKFPGLFASYLIDGMVIQLKFADADGKVLKFARVGLKEDNHVSQGLA